MQTHLLTMNNEKTIQKTLESIRECDSRVMVADMGSTDQTLPICEEHDAEIYRTHYLSRSEARNHLCKLSDNGTKMMIEPWEILVKGHQEAKSDFQQGCVKVINNGIITKETRLWINGEFVNPIYERINSRVEREIDIVFYAVGGIDATYALQLLEQWKMDCPTAPQPHYYHACLALSQGNYDSFLNLSDHYMAMEPNKSCLSAVMNRYYYALANVVHKQKARPALQNLNLCLCANSLMAEFWCLTGDVYYHLLSQFENARQFYRNAIFMGAKRSPKDKWPMEISKYREYPEKMIKSCDELTKYRSTWGR